MEDRWLLSEKVKSIILLSWVIISMAVLLGISVDYIMRRSLMDTMFGILSAGFSLVPLFVYLDLRTG